VIGGTFLARPIMTLLYGTAYANSAAPFQILLWSAALVTLRWVYMDSLRATGHQALDVRCAITSASLNVGLNVLLIPRYGMIGAASATTFADLVWFVMAYHYFRRTVLPAEPFPSPRGPLVGGAAMAAILWLTETMAWPARAALSLIAYLLVQMLFGGFRFRHAYEKIPEK
jgi:O-antigen/teichoic acid export membrane protein